MKKSSFLLLILSIIFLQSCKKEQQTTDDEQQITSDEAKASIEADKETDDLLDLVDVYAFDSSVSNRSYQLPSCVTQTIVRNGTNIIITWEFDANGCTMPNGNTYQGTITITRSVDLTGHQVTGTLTFDQFYVNGKHIEGSCDFVRERSNANGNPQSTHNYNFTITFLNGDTAVRSGTRIREWIEGFGTPNRNDDVFLVTGNSHIERRNGVIIDAVIIVPLRREIPCPYFVSGTVEITKNGQTAVLDYGSGNCDNEATLTLSNGNVIIIHL
jgi:hypothetical protein